MVVVPLCEVLTWNWRNFLKKSLNRKMHARPFLCIICSIRDIWRSSFLSSASFPIRNSIHSSQVSTITLTHARTHARTHTHTLTHFTGIVWKQRLHTDVKESIITNLCQNPCSSIMIVIMQRCVFPIFWFANNQTLKTTALTTLFVKHFI